MKLKADFHDEGRINRTVKWKQPEAFLQANWYAAFNGKDHKIGGGVGGHPRYIHKLAERLMLVHPS